MVNLVFPFQDVFYLGFFFSTSGINLYCIVLYYIVLIPRPRSLCQQIVC